MTSKKKLPNAKWFKHIEAFSLGKIWAFTEPEYKHPGWETVALGKIRAECAEAYRLMLKQ